MRAGSFPAPCLKEHNYFFYEMPYEKTDPYKNAVECEKGTSEHMKEWCLEWGLNKSHFTGLQKVTFYHYKAKTPSHGTTLDGIIDEWKFADSPSAQVFTEALEKRAAMVYANRGAYVCSVDNYVYTFHSRSAGFYNPLLEFFTQFVKEHNAFAPNQKGQRDSY